MKPNSNRGSKPGERRGGRKKGSQNKVTKAAKEAIAEAFERLGSTDGLVAWAQKSNDNEKAFYTLIWPKIVPLTVGGDADEPVVHEIVCRVVRP
jgi:hypothetical protein